ncbi:hypothetical protein RJT34_32816 [Clitoria ternatea]|uniref:Uncharacterized protein n=1 Tax=Clitoria ternatea TaxID=43366 RepID=A0AAN9F0Z4_CLITE
MQILLGVELKWKWVENLPSKEVELELVPRDYEINTVYPFRVSDIVSMIICGQGCGRSHAQKRLLVSEEETKSPVHEEQEAKEAELLT